jgi:hypothetical protein
MGLTAAPEFEVDAQAQVTTVIHIICDNGSRSRASACH